MGRLLEFLLHSVFRLNVSVCIGGSVVFHVMI